VSAKTAVRSEAARRAELAPRGASPAAAMASHWQEYAIEAALLGTFMLSACLFTVLLFHPASPVPGLVPDRFLRRVLMGLAMGGTAVGLVYSAWGKQSGAHFNPAVTLTFTRLGRIAPRDAAAYVMAQFTGAVLGVLAAMLLAGPLVADASVRYAVTVPGPAGPAVAFAAEVLISFILMTVVLTVSGHRRFGRLTGLCAGLLVATFISLEAPLSGMSMNPARTMGSAVWAHDWTALWIYFTAPLLGMLGAAQLHLRRRGREPDACAKLHHQNEKRCIFCEYRMASGTSRGPAAL
jgi:aquaporin Z